MPKPVTGLPVAAMFGYLFNRVPEVPRRSNPQSPSAATRLNERATNGRAV